MTTANGGPPTLALQLYTVRDELERDADATLRTVAEIGYDGVEWFGGLRDRPAEEWRRFLDGLGLRVVAAHVDLETLDRDSRALMDDYEALGCHRLVVPWLPEELRRQPEDWDRVGQRLDRIAYRLRTRGFRLAYHNHDFELAPELEPDGLQRILSWSSHDTLSLEPDVFWLAWAGRDPVRWLRELATTPSRLRLLHLKDGELPSLEARSELRYETIPFRPLGAGEIELEAIVDLALEVGVEALIVEQDFAAGSALDDARRSFGWLRPRVGA